MLLRSTIFGGLALALLVSSGCAPEPGSERWCRNKADVSSEGRQEWSAENWNEYADLCFEEGSKGWCTVQRDMPKDDWGLKEVSHFAMECMIGGVLNVEDDEDAAAK